MDDSETKKNFFSHVFQFDKETKCEISNLLQYSLLSILPVVLLNKTIGRYVPEADEKKGSLEIAAEIILQIVATFLGLYLIHRIVTYLPTYSEEKYPEFHVEYVVLAILMIMLSLQTRLGEKVSILSERLVELWEGKMGEKLQSKDKKKGGGGGGNGSNTNVVVVKPPMTHPAVTQSLYEGTSISSLPTNDMQYGNENSLSPQSTPNYNSMYRQDTTPLVGAASPGQTQEQFEPVAASEFLGGLGNAW
jgi:hypothetical protein